MTIVCLLGFVLPARSAANVATAAGMVDDYARTDGPSIG
jgi:hypothetical protein